jgi:hypothetical protein
MKLRQWLTVAESSHASSPVADAASARAGLLVQHRGTHLQPGAIGASPSLQQEIIAEFARQDPQPAARRAHFQWLDRPGLRVVGWEGAIEQIAAFHGGSLLQVRIRPFLDWDQANIAFTADTFDEFYEYRAPRLRFIKGVEAPGSRRFLFGD